MFLRAKKVSNWPKSLLTLSGCLVFKCDGATWTMSAALKKGRGTVFFDKISCSVSCEEIQLHVNRSCGFFTPFTWLFPLHFKYLVYAFKRSTLTSQLKSACSDYVNVHSHIMLIQILIRDFPIKVKLHTNISSICKILYKNISEQF